MSLNQRGYRNVRVLQEGIPGWREKGDPVAGRRVGRIEHRAYPPAVLEFERRLGAEAIRTAPERR